MREIHDFDTVKNWRWQITERDQNCVGGESGRYRVIRKWRHDTYPPKISVSCNSLGSVISGADFSEMVHRPHFILIRMIERGSLLVLVGRRRMLRFEAGEICLLPPYHDYAGAPDGAECLHHYMTIRGMLLTELLHGFGLDEVCCIRPPSTEDFKSLLEKGFSLPRGSSVRERAANAGFCLEMLQTLSFWHNDDAMPPELAEVTKFIDRHLGEPISAERLAAVAGCSVTRLYQHFHDTLQKTPHRYIVERRMEFARHSLQNGMPVKEIAQACGYRNPFNFSVEFKKFHGVSPRGFCAAPE